MKNANYKKLSAEYIFCLFGRIHYLVGIIGSNYKLYTKCISIIEYNKKKQNAKSSSKTQLNTTHPKVKFQTRFPQGSNRNGIMQCLDAIFCKDICYL